MSSGRNPLRYLVFSLFLILAACSQATPPPPTTPAPVPTPRPGILLVAPDTTQGTVSPYLLGSNYGPWVAVPVAMLPAAYDSGVRIIRFPAGAWGDRNNLKTYQIDYFMDFLANMEAQATISVRLREGSPDSYYNAARRADGALTLMLINLADDPRPATLELTGGLPAQAELWQLTSEQRPETATTVTLPAGGQLTLPAQSVSLYILTS